jgi:hypothetical protein
MIDDGSTDEDDDDDDDDDVVLAILCIFKPKINDDVPIRKEKKLL